jgi:hypothetical protein
MDEMVGSMVRTALCSVFVDLRIPILPSNTVNLGEGRRPTLLDAELMARIMSPLVRPPGSTSNTIYLVLPTRSFTTMGMGGATD